ncbi:AbiJ-NTD4 domain-containing protein [Weissella paramesenteroides]|uniref:AbiJ-NTD4 domain-containing protein n=1 Tax=Weissella paramesenteroides TaxID=1249 RepID=UPI003F20040C
MDKFFHQPSSDFASSVHTDYLEKSFSKLEWYEKYDFLEFSLQNLKTSKNQNELYHKSNKLVLERNNAGFRFVGHLLVPITSPIDLDTISKATNTSISAGHIDNAIQELSKRSGRNTNNVSSESILAVESAVKEYVLSVNPDEEPEKKTLGELLKIIKKNKLLTEDPAYSESMSKLYGYLSNKVRHGKVSEDSQETSLNEATYILEICSAFVNLLAAELAD